VGSVTAPLFYIPKLIMIYYLRNNTKVIFGYVQPIIDDAKFTLKLKNTVTN